MQSKEITSLQNPIIKQFVKLHESRSFRYGNKQVVVVGEKEVFEATKIEILLVKKGISSLPKANTTYFVPDGLLKKVTRMQAPPPYAAIVPMPSFANLQKKQWILGLDGISDPGNLGTLLRSALALGWEGAFLTPSCVDPFNDKALRAGKGAAFRLPLQIGEEKELVELGRKRTTWVAHMDGADLNTVKPGPSLLILGNEGSGVQKAIQEQFPPISIPIQNIESLNVAIAGSILMYGLKS